MSTLHANTVETSSGGPVVLTKQIAATSLLNFQNLSSNVTHRSLNISSVVDDDTGTFNVNFTTSYDAADYIATTSSYDTSPGSNASLVMTTYSGAQAYSTSGCGFMAEDLDGGNRDYDRNFMAFYGDLA